MYVFNKIERYNDWRFYLTRDGNGRIVEVSSDGWTIWANNWRGYLVGRFSAKGIDVHNHCGSGGHCLDCRPGEAPFGKPSKQEYESFAESMLKHHQIEMPDGDDLINEWRTDAHD